jgi:hypothetical protein
MNKFFEGQVTIEEANDEIIAYLDLKKFSNKVLQNLDRRRDKGGKKVRTYAEFFRDISIGTRKEHTVFLEWVKYMQSKGFVIKWEKYGTDAIGLAFVEGNDTRPDYLISFNNSPFYPIDVKTGGTDNINTFKIADLKNYAQHNAMMLSCMGKADVKNPELTGFIFYGNEAIRKLLSFDGAYFHEFAPNKLAVRVARVKLMKNKRGHISFKQMAEERLIDHIIVDNKKPVFKGPMKKLLEMKYNF